MENLKGNWILLHDESGECENMNVRGHATTEAKAAMLTDALIHTLREEVRFPLHIALAYLCDAVAHIYNEDPREGEED